MGNIKSIDLKEDVEYIKIHGLQRSGTNYLTMLVNENLENTECLVNAGGWKHGHYCAPWVLGREVHVLTIVKNPYSWLVSLYKYWSNNKHMVGPNLTGVSFDQFVRNKTEFERQQGIPFLYRAANPVQFWNDMNFHWMSIRIDSKKSLMIPYEFLLENTEEVIKSIGIEFGIKTKENFNYTDCKFEAGEEKPTIDKNSKVEKEYYKEKKYLSFYNTDLLNFVNCQLDQYVLGSLGYSIVKNL